MSERLPQWVIEEDHRLEAAAEAATRAAGKPWTELEHMQAETEAAVAAVAKALGLAASRVKASPKYMASVRAVREEARERAEQRGTTTIKELGYVVDRWAKERLRKALRK